MSAPCPTFGFLVHARLRDARAKADANALRESLIEVIEANGLETGGGGGERTLDYAISREGSQATHADREVVLEWASRWSGVAEIEVSDLVDLRQR
jgi:uncharacterized protein YggL (DUF469 family)